MSRGKNMPAAPARGAVTSSPPALTQSPFAKLAELAAPPAPEVASAAKPVVEKEKKPARSRLLLRRETKHRGGKPVVIIGGFAALADHDEKRLSELARLLKQRLGCGGGLDAETREILIQGDRPEDVAALLRELGYEPGGVTSAPRR